MQTPHHMARMGEFDPFAKLHFLSETLRVRMEDKRDGAKILRRQAGDLITEAEGKDLEADALRIRINRLSVVRARIGGVNP